MVMPVTWAPLVEAMVRMGPPTPQPTSTQVLPGCRIRHKLSCGWGPDGSRLCHASRTQAQAANPGLTRGQEATGSLVWLNVKKQPAMPWVLLLSCRRFHGPE